MLLRLISSLGLAALLLGGVSSEAAGPASGGSPASEMLSNSRWPRSDSDFRVWLQNMVSYHRFTPEEVHEATGVEVARIMGALKVYRIQPGVRPPQLDDAPLVVLPYPGGRHPRIGFLDGAIHPQRETKLSVFARLAALPTTTVAFIDGPCLGAGLELALACDHRLCLAKLTTHLGFPDRVPPCFGGTSRLEARLGRSRAKRFLDSGRTLSGREAQTLGLVDLAFCERRAKIELRTFLDELERAPRVKLSRELVGLAEERRVFARTPNPPAPFPQREGGESPSPLRGGVGEGFAEAASGETAIAIALPSPHVNS